MQVNDNMQINPQAGGDTSVPRSEYDKVVAERDKLARAVNRLINALAQRYANDLAKEVMED